MTIEKKGLRNNLNSAQESLAKINKDKYPKLYASKESEIKALKIAIDKTRWVKKVEKSLKDTPPKKKTSQNKGEPTPKKQGFDYAEKAFLQVNDVKPSEYKLVQQIMNDTGKTLEGVLESKYFRAEQKELRDQIASEDAIPEGGKRPSKIAKDNVNYWIDRDELPEDTIENRQLRRNIVNEKLKRVKEKSQFSDMPVGRLEIR